VVIAGTGSVGIGPSPAESDLTWSGTIDGEILPAAPLELIEDGAHTHMPVIVGSNADEAAAPDINRLQVTEENFAAAVREGVELFTGRTMSDDALARAVETYPLDAYPTPHEAFIQAATDAAFTCPTRALARVAASAQSEPVFRYFLSRRAPTPDAPAPAAHGVDLFYLFRTPADIPDNPIDDADLTLSDQMMEAWIRFAATGDAAGGLVGKWPRYAQPEEASLVFDAPLGFEDQVRGDRCDVWDAIAPIH
jgi:para-nitrobenzyl esterase